MNPLFESAKLGPLFLKNRLVMTAMSTRLADTRGRVTDRLIAYYGLRAAGGVGLVTVEEAAIHPQLMHIPAALGVFSDDQIPGLASLVDRIHESGAKASLQIGLYFRPDVSGFPRYAVSLKSPAYGPGCRELDAGDIEYLVKLFASAAVRTRAAGFDAVEVHACHGCIISEFLSPFWNQRTDEYGGNPGRFRFALEILSTIREKVGPDYPVLYRISGSEFYDGGFTSEDGISLSKALEKGGVTAISVSGGLGHINHIAIPPSDVPRGILLPLAAEIKSAVRVPVIVGNSLTPEMAEKAVRTGQADLIGLGRPLIADPDWPTKTAEGRTDEIRHCIRCNQGCFGGLRNPAVGSLTCLYNPQAGRETVRTIKTAGARRKVLVIGGGPAGCEAARVGRLRGHDVTLYEKKASLGGQWRLASVPPKKDDFNLLVRFYQENLPRIGVKLRLNEEITPDQAVSMAADVIVIATGSRPVRPDIPGIHLPHVVSAHQVLSGEFSIEAGPVAVVGGGATGLETADYLSEKGISVVVVEMLLEAGRDMQPGIGVREALMARLSEKNVETLCGCRVISIGKDSVTISNRPLRVGGDLRHIPASTVVLALGAVPDPMWPLNLKEFSGKLLQVGDCRCPANAMTAIHNAFDVAVHI